MNLAELQKKLIAAARLNPPDDRVPYAFEKRIMALIAARTGADRWVFWTRGLWRAAASCVAVAVVLRRGFAVHAGTAGQQQRPVAGF